MVHLSVHTWQADMQNLDDTNNVRTWQGTMANYGMVFLPSSSSSTPYTTGVAPVVALVSLGDTITQTTTPRWWERLTSCGVTWRGRVAGDSTCMYTDAAACTSYWQDIEQASAGPATVIWPDSIFFTEVLDTCILCFCFNKLLINYYDLNLQKSLVIGSYFVHYLRMWPISWHDISCYIMENPNADLQYWY